MVSVRHGRDVAVSRESPGARDPLRADRFALPSPAVASYPRGVATMSMNKAIHHAFRRDLARFVQALDGFSEGDATRAELLGKAWDNFDFQLTKHHEGEHEIAWPALAQVGVSQDVLDQMDAEHEVMAERLAAARGAMAAFRAAATRANADAARQAMAELQTVTTEHLDHEERGRSSPSSWPSTTTR